MTHSHVPGHAGDAPSLLHGVLCDLLLGRGGPVDSGRLPQVPIQRPRCGKRRRGLLHGPSGLRLTLAQAQHGRKKLSMAGAPQSNGIESTVRPGQDRARTRKKTSAKVLVIAAKFQLHPPNLDHFGVFNPQSPEASSVWCSSKRSSRCGAAVKRICL